MIPTLKNIEILERFPILKALPKQCSCTACSATKNEIKSQIGEKEYLKICRAMSIG